MNSLSKLINLINILAEAVHKWVLDRRKKELKDAAEEATKTGDQRGLERSVGSDSAGANSSGYDGMFIRKAKKRPGDMVD